ncbi:MAG: sigma-54 interaction domain-containing protein [Bacillus sp. (in: firmicutes)]
MESFFNHKLLDIVLESTYHGTVIVDREGLIQYISKNYCEFLKIDRTKAIGEHVTNVIENTRLHLVVQTGKIEMAEIQFLRGHFVIANRIPLIEDNVIIGAIGMMYRSVDKWKEMSANLKESLSKHTSHLAEGDKTGIRYRLHDFIGESPDILKLKERVKKVAQGDISVLIRGESGTGKEMVAHSIHQLSDRSERAFVKLNCGAIPETLLESELFGYEEGAFSGAKKGGKIGKLQLAEGGTFFLDEIGDMPLHLQVKLMRVLQEKEYEPLGSLQTKRIDVRFIAATNQPIEALIKRKRFREDLYYRINAIQLVISPLRERMEDLPLLSDYFLRKVAARLGKPKVELHPEVLSVFNRYSWPGNVRELENVIEAGAHLSDDGVIKMEDLPDYLNDDLDPKQQYNLPEMLEKTEEKVILQAFKACDSDKRKTAEMLGIGMSTLYDKLKKYNVSKK